MDSHHNSDPLAEELKRESERLLKLADELTSRQQSDAEMRANYPFFRRAIYAELREKFIQELPSLPDQDLETWAREDGSLPLEGFIDQLEQPSGSTDRAG